ncbi:hypothetical protein FHX37_0747 [Haloactinospora alba]|uniref:Cobalamin-independent methionine synthase catalytic subunit n=1 Tax=Haloactinospora alba TaxID=405555 RepID=A0A543NG92_9ACTN|nr:methionine synthase [Haloactinospora alba]TQN30859.1 hypothetical protein FHX37_0747 [Haloactinospora alba]
MSELHQYPWPEASSTGVGSFPGTDAGEALRTVLGELPDLAHLPELPERGTGADSTGRSAALLADLPVETGPFAWRVTQRPGRDARRAASFLSYDLEALETHGHDYQGLLKIQVLGPWSLAARLELRGGEKLLSDPGAVRDLCESQREGVREHIADVRARVPGAGLLVQMDEPLLPDVLLGAVPSASGYRTLPAVDRVTVEERLRALYAAISESGAVPGAHCCRADPPVDLLRRSGARALSLNARALPTGAEDAVGTAVEDGVGLLLGTVASTDTDLSDPAVNVAPVRELWNRIGFAPELLSVAVAVTPVCGLAGVPVDHARAVLEACGTAARVLRDDPC